MFARRRTTVKNLLPGFLPPTSVTARRDNVWVPADVDEALDRLYDRLVAEFVETWYTEVSPHADEEFLQQVRLAMKVATETVLKRVSRLDLTSVLVTDVIPTGLQHLDSYLWARQHCTLEGGGDCLKHGKRCSCHLHSTWLAFTAGAVHPAGKQAEGGPVSGGRRLQAHHASGAAEAVPVQPV